jgi:arginase family enzyme
MPASSSSAHVLDQELFAATDYPMPGGLDWAEAEAVLAAVGSSPRLAGVLRQVR